MRTAVSASVRELATILFYALALAGTGAPQTTRGRSLDAVVDRLPLGRYVSQTRAELSFLKFFWGYRLRTMRRSR